jgi:hypothetical protein
MAESLPARALQQKKLATPRASAIAVTIAVERNPKDLPAQLMFSRDRGEMSGMMLNTQHG